MARYKNRFRTEEGLCKDEIEAVRVRLELGSCEDRV